MERSTAIRYTYKDLLSIPEDQRRYEIIDGELFVTPGPRLDHQRVARNLLVLLDVKISELGLGEVVGPMTVHFHDELVLEPDVIFVRKGRAGIMNAEGHVHGAPDLVVEILSPSTQAYDRNLKRKKYLESGVAEVWLVDLDDRSIEVWLADSALPKRVTDALVWSVGGEELDLPLAAVFRGVRQR